MLPPITKKYVDLSTKDYFLFRFLCDCCGDFWESEKYPFSQCDKAPKNSDEQYVQELIWRSEHDAAYERANNEALFHFSKCSNCGRRLCDKCFDEGYFICKQCGAREKTKKGE